MKKVPFFATLIVLAVISYGYPFKDSCRCNHRIVETGFTRAQVIRLCGEPTTSTSDMLVYDLGHNRLVIIFHFENGRLKKIEYRDLISVILDGALEVGAYSRQQIFPFRRYTRPTAYSFPIPLFPKHQQR